MRNRIEAIAKDVFQRLSGHDSHYAELRARLEAQEDRIAELAAELAALQTGEVAAPPESAEAPPESADKPKRAKRK